jgi:hypothetical protein
MNYILEYNVVVKIRRFGGYIASIFSIENCAKQQAQLAACLMLVSCLVYT